MDLLASRVGLAESLDYIMKNRGIKKSFIGQSMMRPGKDRNSKMRNLNAGKYHASEHE